MSQKVAVALAVPESLYVGIQSRGSFNTETFPLGFATPYGTNAEFTKRKDTVDDWAAPGRITRVYRRDEQNNLIPDPERGAGYWLYDDVDKGEYNGTVIDNTLTEGFTFEKSVSRWSTSNKWFTINDPRGFSLQITAENLGDIIVHSSIVNGELQGKYVWARYKGNVFLCRENHPAYQSIINPVVTQRQELKVGDKIRIGQQEEEHVYLGKFFSLRIGYQTRYFDKATNTMQGTDFNPYGRGYAWNRSWSDDYYYEYVTYHKKDPVAVHLVGHKYGDKWSYHLYRQPPKSFTLIEENVEYVLPDIGTPFGAWTQLDTSGAAILFDTKKALVDFDDSVYDFKTNLSENITEFSSLFADRRHIGTTD